MKNIKYITQAIVFFSICVSILPKYVLSTPMCLEPYKDPSNTYAVVFQGKVISKESLTERTKAFEKDIANASDEEHKSKLEYLKFMGGSIESITTFQVEKVFYGPKLDKIEIYHMEDGLPRVIYMDKQSYIIYANQTEKGRYKPTRCSSYHLPTGSVRDLDNRRRGHLREFDK